MIEIRRKQLLFAQLLPLLIIRAQQLGYGVVIGPCYRTAEEAQRKVEAGTGIHPSLHELCLAADIYLFDERGYGDYLQETPHYEPIGLWWEAQHELCSWGGRFNDGNHFSIRHGGLR